MRNLYNLVHKLNQSEKRYIKLRLSSTKSSSKSLFYFETILKQKEYDFETLLKLSGKTTPVLRSNLDKLYRSILKQLRVYHSNSNDESRLNGILTDVCLLQEKGLVKEAKKMNAKLIKIAFQFELWEIANRSILKQWEFLQYLGELSYSKSQQIENEISYCHRRVEQVNELRRLCRLAKILSSSAELEREFINNEVHNLLNNPALSNQQLKLSVTAEFLSYDLKYLCFKALGNLEQCYYYKKKQVGLLFSSSLYQHDYSKKSQALNQFFTILKSEFKLKELKFYLNFFYDYFYPLIERSRDNRLKEIIFDVYIRNRIFELQYNLKATDVPQLINLFKDYIHKRGGEDRDGISNLYVRLLKLVILTNDLKKSISLIIDFQDWHKSYYSSPNYIETELLLLFVYFSKKKWDVFGGKFDSFKKIIKEKALKLNKPQTVFYKVLLNKVEGRPQRLNSDKVQDEFYKVLILSVLEGKSPEVIRPKVFKCNSSNYNHTDDKLLILLQRKLKCKEF